MIIKLNDSYIDYKEYLKKVHYLKELVQKSLYDSLEPYSFIKKQNKLISKNLEIEFEIKVKYLKPPRLQR